MFLDAEMQLAYKVGNTPFNMFPYPHFYVPDVFPADFYQTIQQNLPDPQAMVPMGDVRPVTGYPERFVFDFTAKSLATLPESKREFWRQLNQWLVVKGNFGTLVFEKFKPFIGQRFKDRDDLEFQSETLLVQDITNYKLGPHTDSPRKVVTMLFYLPPDLSQVHLGTSMYLPNDPAFTCLGGPHHNRENFTRLHTNPFAPNSLFAFFKTDNSFHGVEPVADPNTRRWLLLYDIYVRETAAKPVVAAPRLMMTNPKFSF